MKHSKGNLRFSASDLSNHLACRHLTNLDLWASLGKIKPPEWRDPSLITLQQRGFEHERAYVAHLASQGLSIKDLASDDSPALVAEQTLQAMQEGFDVIVQSVIGDEKWFGKPDILRKVRKPSRFGDWSYEVVDTKLARETKSGTILQLCLYSEYLAVLQGNLPELMHVVPPFEGYKPISYRTADFFAYHRLVKSRLLTEIEKQLIAQDLVSYPNPTKHCDICRWWSTCDKRRRADDHLSYVAGASKLQISELKNHNIQTMQKLAEHPLPFKEKFSRGNVESYVRIREQARVQVAKRKSGNPLYETLDLQEGRGLFLLPPPSPGDIFFDIEGDPFFPPSGLEYLFGLIIDNKYISKWAFTYETERSEFQWLIQRFMDQWAKYPEFHIYHYAPYEPSAMKRLMGRYGVMENEVDRLLRAGKFVDLYTVVRQSVRASVESYSIKDLEQFYGLKRLVPLEEASKSRHALENALEMAAAEKIDKNTLELVEGYNRDDCQSLVDLQKWLEAIRTSEIKKGCEIPRPTALDGDPSEEVSEREQRIRDLFERLTRNVPAVPEERSSEQKGLSLLADLLSWHLREAKAPWWEYFRLMELTDEELLNEKQALAGLRFMERTSKGTARCPVDKYTFSEQETNLRAGDKLYLSDGDQFGTLEEINLVNRTVEVKKRSGMAETHPTAVFEHNIVNTGVLSDAIFRLGEWVAENGIDANGDYSATRNLLLRKPPTINGSAFEIDQSKPVLQTSVEIVAKLGNSVLPIQGPPGAGKTFTAANMICDLLSKKMKVGVTAVSHKVIENLLESVATLCREKGINARVAKKVSESSEESGIIEEISDNEEALGILQSDQGAVLGGTAWLWSREDAFDTVDVLFVDEAGQMSLANVVAVAQSCQSLILIGDPQQLEQPLKGSHPPGTEVSALDHLLEGQKTIPLNRGLFLGETWRLHPRICAFTSELFYEGRLSSRPELALQQLSNCGPFDGSGLFYAPVEHMGNQNVSPEEVQALRKIIDRLLAGSWTSAKGEAKKLTLDDILVVTPYNAQVFRILDSIPGVRAGTVDKFQGQEAPVAIFSMATSSYEDAPRGMEFLYSLNRLNVATSRAQCCSILISNPQIFEADCKNPRQMQLANAFCRYLELAKRVDPTAF